MAANSKKHVLISSKGINVWDDESNVGAWEWMGENKKLEDVKLFSRFPWLWRGIRLISSSAANVPFIITRGEDEIDTSLEYKNAIGFLPNPKRLISVAIAARQLTGRAYMFKSKNVLKMPAGLRNLNPASVEPVFKKDGKDAGALEKFERSITTGGATRKVEYPVEDILYSWMYDPFVEIGPPLNYPAKAAMMAAGVLSDVDQFLASFFQRGAVKATLLTVGANTQPQERSRLEEWWNQFFSGVTGERQKVINADTVTPVVVGEGLEGLDDSDLAKKKREDIAAALGIPMTKLFSTEAGGLGGGGVVDADDRRFMEETLLPEVEALFEDINTQLLVPLGYRIEVNAAAIDLFQEDERQRSFALNNLAAAININPDVAEFAMSVLGYEIDDEQQAMFNAIKGAKMRERQERQQQVRPNAVAAPRDEREGDERDDARGDESPPRAILHEFQERQKEIGQWQRNALRIGGKRSAEEFEPGVLSNDMVSYIKAALPSCADKDAIKALFTSARELLESGVTLSPALVGAVGGALEKSKNASKVLAGINGKYP